MTVVCACGWLSHFAVFSFSQLRGWVPLFFSFHPIMRAMSVLSSNDCLAFSLSHHWGTLGTWQQVSKTTLRLLEWLWCVHVCGCHILLYFLLSHRRWVPLFFSFHSKCVQCLCSVLMTALPSLYLTSGEHLDHDRKWVRLPHNSLNYCGVCMWVVVKSCCIFSSYVTQRVSPTVFSSFHPKMRAMFVLASNDCLAFSLFYHWATLGTWQKVSMTTSRLLKWLRCVRTCVVVTTCCISFCHIGGESHYSVHFTQ